METYNHKDLFKAIEDKDFERFKSLVEKYSKVIDVNQLNRDNEFGETLFERAFICEEYDMAKILIDKFKDSIDLNRKDCEGNNIFGRSLYYISDIEDEDKQTYSIKFFVENFKDSIDINQTTTYGNTALMIACRLPKLIKYLIEIFSETIDINQVNQEGKNALMVACENRDLDIVKYLVEKFKDSIDINQFDENGNNALTISILCNEDYETANFLVDNFKDSIDINRVNKEGYSTFLCEYKDMCYDHEEMKYIDEEDNLCNSPIYKFVIDNFKDSININQTDKNGNTALMLACNKGYHKLVKFLIENFKENININQTNKDGYNALTLASKNKDIVKFLTENFGNNIDEKNVDDESIIPCALTEHIQSKEYKIKKFESIDTIFIKIGDKIRCYTFTDNVNYDEEKDNKKILLNVDTGSGRYMKTDDEGVDVYRYHNRTDTILYS
jgi:ankyrin repeat protein